ncbi:MAG: DUF6249 domain-containing protein [Myxococcota bacterium]
MEDDIVAKLVPIAVVTAIAAIPIVAQYFSFRRRRDTLRTVRQLLETRDDIDESLIRTLVSGRQLPFADLRRGLLFLALALAGAAFSFFIEATEASSLLRGAAMFPLVLGLTYVAFHLFLRARD